MPPRSLWFLIPILGLVELGAHVYFANRAPDLEQWRALAAEVSQLKRPGDLVVTAPEWAEPIARQVLGADALPVGDLARPDDRAYRHAIEVSTLGQRAPELAGWRELERRESGKFTLRRLENPSPVEVEFRFVDHVRPPHLVVSQGGDEERELCPFNPRAPSITGGLHGPVAFPRERYACSGGPAYFVGVTIIDDQDYRPRRCIFAHPTVGGSLRLTFADVPLGKVIRGHAGLSYFLARDGAGTPVELRVFANDRELGRYEHRDEWGWKAFQFSTGEFAGTTQNVDFEIRSALPSQRDFCFTAETF
jgi:hypothetical protein